MTTAAAIATPRPLRHAHVHNYGADILTVTDEPTEEKLYSAAELLDIVLAAYERGIKDGYTNRRREYWREPGILAAFRHARMRTEATAMRRRSDVRHTIYGYPEGYDYRGGPVDWTTGMPAGSGCAWLRRQRLRQELALAGGPQ